MLGGLGAWWPGLENARFLMKFISRLKRPNKRCHEWKKLLNATSEMGKSDFDSLFVFGQNARETDGIFLLYDACIFAVAKKNWLNEFQLCSIMRVFYFCFFRLTLIGGSVLESFLFFRNEYLPVFWAMKKTDLLEIIIDFFFNTGYLFHFQRLFFLL